MENKNTLWIVAIVAVVLIYLTNPSLLGLQSSLAPDGYDDTDLSPSTTYYYKVSAYNEFGTSANSAVFSATTLAAPVEQTTSGGGGSIQTQPPPVVTTSTEEVITPPTEEEGTNPLLIIGGIILAAYLLSRKKTTVVHRKV